MGKKTYIESEKCVRLIWLKISRKIKSNMLITTIMLKTLKIPNNCNLAPKFELFISDYKRIVEY